MDCCCGWFVAETDDVDDIDIPANGRFMDPARIPPPVRFIKLPSPPLPPTILVRPVIIPGTLDAMLDVEGSAADAKVFRGKCGNVRGGGDVRIAVSKVRTACRHCS